jgi:hypothetical protein
MARLIPRKQIEEQQDISGSFIVRENLSVGNDVIISGSLLVSKSLFLGNDLNDKSEITGSVFLTGSFIIDGKLNLAGPQALLSATASNALQSQDTVLYDGIRSKDFGANLPTLYVSSTDGDDNNDGRSIQYPLRTIKKAASLATPGYDGRYGFDTGSVFNGYVLKVQAGTYLEDNPVILPKNTSIWGAGLRITKINAKNPEQDLFYVNSGCYIAEVTMGGLRLYPDQINPERGFAVAFQPGAFITTSPYIQNCSQISNQENSFTELYEDIPPGGGGLYVNGDVIDPDSPLASMVLDAYTQISPNGVGCLVNGRGFIQLVSFFNNFSYYAIRVNNGGQATLNNSNISFGLYGMYASGSRFISGSGGNIAARDSVRGTWSCVVDVLNKGLENGLPTITKLNTAEGIRLTSPTLYTQSRVPATTTLSTTAADEISADYTLISEIVDKGVSNFPTLLAKSSIKGYGFDSPYNILGAQQITSSISATNTDLTNISASYAALLSILANGTGSFNFKSNTNSSRKIGSDTIQPITNISPLTGSVSSSFGTVINIITKGVFVKPTYVANASGSVKGGSVEQVMLGVTSSLATINSVSASFSIVYNILANGTGSSILPIPANHKKSFVISNNNSSSFNFEGIGNNPTLTLFRGETYKFNVDAVETFGGIEYPFWIRTQQLEGITEKYDYNTGIVNNGDSRGTITFTVPYNAPNRLYYVSQNRSSMGGTIEIVNSSTTPFDLIKNTLTYPATIQSGSIAKTNIDIVTAYEILTNNKSFIEEEVIEFVNSSWADFVYDESTCRRDVGYIVDGVTKDLLFGGNEESIRSGLFYYQYPSQATTTQLGPTLTAMKHAAGVSLNLIRGKVYVEPSTEAIDVWDAIRDNKTFVQNEVITYLSSSWSNFYYNEAKCRRDTGYILDAVATDAKYGGNERSIIAGEYYYQYPSLAIVRGDGDGVGQLGQTSDGIRYASGLVDTLLKKITFQAPSATTLSAYNNLINNKELIQNETIQFINVAFPSLKYNQATCKRDVGYIVDNVATDLLYGGIERGVTAGRYYYDYPSIATTTQRTSTIAGVKYAKIIGDTIVQNIILDTPRIVYNDEKNFRASSLVNVTSSFSGSATQQTFIGNSFSIIEGIVARGLSSIKSLLAQNTGLTWNKYNPISVSSGSQITSSYSTPNEVNTISRNFDIVNTIIGGGLVAEPLFTASQANTIAVTGTSQITASFAASGSVSSSISASIAYVATIITNGTGSLGTLVSNLNSNVKVTNTPQYTTASIYYGTSTESTQLSSSINVITNILEGGLSAVPALTSSVNANIKVTNTSQYISASSANASDVNFISSSISIVTKIIEGGEFSAPAFQTYTTRLTSSNSVAAYEILKNNIPFIQNETIAYLSSSWAGFVYDETKCKRDLGFILSGSAEDLIWNANSASVFNGLFYWEFPSQAQGAQLQQTLDGINYASRLAQKVIQNVPFTAVGANALNAASLLVNNKVFIQNETIAYLSSSWSEQAYIESTCKRDIGHVIDAIRTDLVYGGNERSRNAGIYYYQYPSQATGSQLLPTLDGINYAGRMIQKIVTGSVFVSADENKINASNLILRNKNLIANEVVAYVSSSWSEAEYNQAKCLRDTKYILDAVRTDLVYGGNERTRFAGEYYYRYPSAAIVGGVPSATQQLDPTITGVNYANQLVQNIIKNVVLLAPSSSVLNVASLLKTNRAFLQQNTVDYANETYPNLDYIESKCYRDTGFIVDAVITDLVYGGNERSITAGRFYYLYPSQATGVQSEETIDSLNFTKGLAKLVAIGGKSIEDGFDIVANVIESGSNSAPNIILNTAAGIKATTANQITSSISVTTNDKSIISSSFGNILNIVSNGTGSIPTTIVKNTNRGVKVLGGTQITSSITPADTEKVKVTTGFDIVIDIVANGTGSIPTIVTNVNSLIKRTTTNSFITTASIESTYLTASNNSFDIILDIVENGTGSLPILVKNTDSLVKITNTNQYTSSIIISSSLARNISGSFDKIINILENGTGSLPTIVSNVNNIKTTATSQYISGSSATVTEVGLISASISIVTNVIANGTNNTLGNLSLPTSSYVTAVSNDNRWIAYGILKNNLTFIQNETIAYLSSSWSTASYDESKCRRDIGLIISGAIEDLVFNSNSASVVNGKFYYDYPSQAQGAQLNQTLDGIKYASRLAQKLVLNIPFVTQSPQVQTAYTLLVNNKEFIKDEVIPYISSSWSTHQYVESTCKRDIVHIIDAVSTDLLYGGNERTINAGVFYYKYPSAATGSQIEETVTGIEYARNLAFKILRGNTFVKVSQNKLQAKELIYNNRAFIQNEVISYISASWSTASYNETTCKRDVGHILDAVTTDIVYGGNERSINAGKFYYEYPSQATTSQLGPTLDGIKYAKDLTNKVLINSTFVSASNSNVTAYELIFNNKAFIQNETIAYLSSSWSSFPYNQTTCKRDIGYILDAVATDILYGGNERVANAGEYYYLYPSLATEGNDGDTGGQLNQTLDGIKYAKGITEKIVANLLLQSPTTSELTGFNLLLDNKKFIQSESIAYLSSSWSGGDGFYYNETTCKRDIGYIIDAVRTDLVYGGNERSSKAGEYYYLYPSAAILTGSVSPTAATQKGPTLDGIKYVAGTAENVIANKVLISPTGFTTSSVNLLRQNKTFIQNETVQYIDAFFPNLVYLRETCRRDVGYILDAVITDTFYGGNQRSVIAGQYYYLYPSLATKSTQVRETVAGVDYAKALAKAIAQNIKLNSPTLTTNTDGNIKVTNTTQYTSSLGATTTEVNQISSSFALVTNIVENGLTSIPTIIENGNGLIKVTNTIQYSSSISASGAELDIITSSFKHVADIIEKGVSFVPDSLARNYNYGFELATPTLLHISSKEQTIGTASYNLSTQITNVSSSYGSVVNVVKNGLSVLPTLVANTSSSLKVTNVNPIRQASSASSFDTNKIASGFDLILSVIENGTSLLPTIVSNTSASIKVTNTPQIISGSAAGRLQGKLISSSLSLVIDVLLSNGTSSIGLKQSTFPIANTNAKINSAYNLLVSNSKFIVDETIAYMSSSWSGFAYTQSKCERDLTGILSGSAFDLLYGGNSASLFNGKFYFDFPSQATGSQLDQTITAIKYASGLAEKVVLNTVFTHISASINQPTSASWNSLRANKGFIQSESIAYLSSSWSSFGYNETTCKRDIGYVIDAVATDLLYGGNERSVVAGRYYYDYPSQATNAQLEPTLTGVRYAKGTAMNVVVNKEVFTSSLATQYAYDLIKANKLFIQSESIAFVNVKYPHLEYSESKCYRDLGYIIDGVATDLLYGGNERSRDNADYYYQFPSQANASGSQVVETVEAIKYAARITTASISSTLIGTPQIIRNTLGNIKVTNATQYISASSATSTEATILSASIAIVTNIVANGTGSAIVSASLSLPTSSYTTAVSNDNRWIAYGILKNNISFIQDETIAYLSSSWSTASYDESKCRRDVGLIISGAAEDLVFNSNSASVFNGKFYYQYPSQAQGAQLNQTLDGINYASKLAQNIVQNVTYVTPSAIVSASYALIRKNREFIQNETIAYLSSSWSTASYIESTCKRDVGHIIDAVSTDLLYGGNERSTNAGVFYYLYPSQAQGAQLQPTLTGVKYAGQLSKNVAASLTFVIASQIVSASVNLLRKNREFIQNETLAYLTASWSTFEYDKDKCKRDVGYILDGVTTDLLYGGNERGVLNGKFYYEYPSLAIVEGDGDGVGQLGQTIDGINYAGRIAQKIVKNIVFQTASLQASASFDLLRKNKAFIAEETIAYVSSSWSGVYYNQTTCKRDVGYLIDAAATDVLYGGQERSVIAGQYYYLYPSNAINKGVPSTQNQLDPTLTGIRYAGKLSKNVVINPTYLVPSASLLTTAKLLTDNKQLIQKETITFLSSSWSGLKYNEVSCSRDLGFIIDAIRTDLVYGGNERSIEAGSYYYKFPSVAIVESYGDNNGQKKQTIDGINFAKGISEKIVANTLLTYLAPTTLRRQAAERLKGGKEELKQRAIGYTNGAFPYLVYNEASCSRDTGFIVDAAVTDLLYGGNERGIRAASSYYDGQYGSAIAVTRDQLLETLETNRYLRTRAEFIAAGAPLESFGSLIVATGIDYSYNGSGVTFKALPPNQGGSGVANPIYEITELGGGRIFFTSGNQDGDFRIGTGLSINQATGTLVGRTFSKSLFSLVTPFSLALQI